MSDIRFNRWLHQSGTGGVYQASSGNVGVGTSVPSTTLDVNGSISATSFTATTGTITGNLSIGGVLSYEDVTNIDSVGIITARSDVSIADKIVHTGDTNTAIRFPAADTFTVETGGAERLRITSDGDLVMNGASPNHDTSSGSLFVKAPSGNPNRGIKWSETSDTHYVKLEPSVIDGLTINGYSGVAFATGSRTNSTWAERLRVSSTGAVGFNTTLVGSSQTVHIAGDYKTSTQNVADEGLIFQSFTTASTGDVYPGISWSGNPNALGRARAAITAIATNNNSGSDLVFLTRNQADGTELDVTDDEKLRITSDGKMGLGTQTPGQALSIAGSSAGLGIYNTGNNHGNVYFYKDGTAKGWLKYRGNDDKLVIGNVTDAINVLSSGWVGVNCTPFAQFHVKTGTNANISMSTMSSEAAIEAYNDAGSANVPLRLRGQDFKFYTSSTERLRMLSNGVVLIGRTSFQEMTILLGLVTPI